MVKKNSYWSSLEKQLSSSLSRKSMMVTRTRKKRYHDDTNSKQRLMNLNCTILFVNKAHKNSIRINDMLYPNSAIFFGVLYQIHRKAKLLFRVFSCTFLTSSNEISAENDNGIYFGGEFCCVLQSKLSWRSSKWFECLRVESSNSCWRKWFARNSLEFW